MKPSTVRDVKKAFSEIEQKMNSLEKNLQEASGKPIYRDPSMMVKDPSPMFDNNEEAQQVLENPDITLAMQYVQDIVTKSLKK